MKHCIFSFVAWKTNLRLSFFWRAQSSTLLHLHPPLHPTSTDPWTSLYFLALSSCEVPINTHTQAWGVFCFSSGRFQKVSQGPKWKGIWMFSRQNLPFCRKSWHFKRQPSNHRHWEMVQDISEFVFANALTSPQRPDRACWKALETWKNSGTTLSSLIQSNTWTHCTSGTILALGCVLGL